MHSWSNLAFCDYEIRTGPWSNQCLVILRLVQALGVTLEEQDVEAFTEAVKEYDSISRLDPWYDKTTQVGGGLLVAYESGLHLGSLPCSFA